MNSDRTVGEMAGPVIRRYEPRDGNGVIAVIVPIQREEFGIAISAQDQPDLAGIPAFYQTGCGEFLVAEAGGRLVGTIGLKDLGEGRGALRKMFVVAGFRGREHGVAQALLDSLLAHARTMGLADIFLGTTERFVAAHRFYERNGFSRIVPEQLPAAFPRMAVDTRFYHLKLH